MIASIRPTSAVVGFLIAFGLAGSTGSAAPAPGPGIRLTPSRVLIELGEPVSFTARTADQSLVGQTAALEYSPQPFRSYFDQVDDNGRPTGLDFDLIRPDGRSEFVSSTPDRNTRFRVRTGTHLSGSILINVLPLTGETAGRDPADERYVVAN